MRQRVWFGLVSALALAGCVAPPPRGIRVAGDRLLWRADGREVALWGVNYNAPFVRDYADVARAGLSHEQVIETDLEHLRRLGVDYVRLHTFDAQFTDREGNLVETEHLRLLDYLVSRLSEKGLFVVLTPIAWWHASAKGADGFSNRYTMPEMTSDPHARDIQCRYLKNFGARVNRYTGRRYADEPAILAFELINEPKYREGLTDGQVTDYVNALAAALRSTGTDKPIFFSEWQGRDKAVFASTVDGVTNASYPTGLDARIENKARRRLDLLVPPATEEKTKPRIIYEFDAADTMDPSFYPAFAKSFRARGIQMASQFQYDLLPLASSNLSWRTHYLNLVYTPARALAFAIGGEIMRHTPRGTPYGLEGGVISLPNGFIDSNSGAAVYAADDRYLSVGTVSRAPTDAARLAHVGGCGSSPVVRSDGSGCYFLDKVSPGVWRLQLYPNVRRVGDPFSGEPFAKTLVTDKPITLTVRLPDLGAAYRVWRADGAATVADAEDGTVTLAPGAWWLTRGAAPSGADRRAAQRLPTFALPPLTPESAVTPARLSALETRQKNAADAAQAAGVWRLDILSKKSRFGTPSYAPKGYCTYSFPVDGEPFARRFPETATDASASLAFRLRAEQATTRFVEVRLTTDEGVAYGCVVPLTTDWKTSVVPLAKFRILGWSRVKTATAPLSVGKIREIGLTIGKWLDAQTPEGSHGVEIDSVTVAAKEAKDEKKK